MPSQSEFTECDVFNLLMPNVATHQKKKVRFLPKLNTAQIDSIKNIVRKIPGVQPFLNWKGSVIGKFRQIQKLSEMINENQYLTFPSDSGIGQLSSFPRVLANDIIREYSNIFGIIRLRKSTVKVIGCADDTYLLYAPQAILRIPRNHNEYLTQLRSKTRTVINKSERLGYEFREFEWNNHTNEIFEINTSKEIRQSESMHGWYRDPVQPRNHSEAENQYLKYYGGFKNGKLYAYFHFWECGEFAFGKHIIGHADHLQNGIMNGLVSWTVRNLIEQSNLKWVTYGSWQATTLGDFKKHAGFQEFAFLINVSGDVDLSNFCKTCKVSILRV